jgi:hypothetical protein
MTRRRTSPCHEMNRSELADCQQLYLHTYTAPRLRVLGTLTKLLTVRVVLIFFLDFKRHFFIFAHHDLSCRHVQLPQGHNKHPKPYPQQRYRFHHAGRPSLLASPGYHPSYLLNGGSALDISSPLTVSDRLTGSAVARLLRWTSLRRKLTRPVCSVEPTWEYASPGVCGRKRAEETCCMSAR